MPSAHRVHAEWTPSRLISWADRVGPTTARLVTCILESRPHPEQGYRTVLGFMRLGRQLGDARLDAASGSSHLPPVFWCCGSICPSVRSSQSAQGPR